LAASVLLFRNLPYIARLTLANGVATDLITVFAAFDLTVPQKFVARKPLRLIYFRFKTATLFFRDSRYRDRFGVNRG
jgi:hypothetical protein